MINVKAYVKSRYDISSMYRDAKRQFQEIEMIVEGEYYYFVVGKLNE